MALLEPCIRLGVGGSGLVILVCGQEGWQRFGLRSVRVERDGLIGRGVQRLRSSFVLREVASRQIAPAILQRLIQPSGCTDLYSARVRIMASYCVELRYLMNFKHKE